MWELEQADKFKSKFPKYKKNHPEAVLATVNNLDTCLGALNAGAKPLIMHFGFLHREPHGICAIDQSGGDGSLKETRLYVYPHEESKTLYLLTIGEKGQSQQKADIADCISILKQIRKGTQ